MDNPIYNPRESRKNKTSMLAIKSQNNFLELERVIAFAFVPGLRINEQYSIDTLKTMVTYEKGITGDKSSGVADHKNIGQQIEHQAN